MVLSLTALTGVASAGEDVDLKRFGLVLLAMLLAQLAIGWMNDYVDRDTDALNQPSKPVPSGLVAAFWLPPASVLAALGSFVLGAVLGPAPLGLLAAGLAAGLAYDLLLKNTGLSWLPFVVAFTVLPLYVWSALDVFRDDFLWLYFVASPLTLAVHVANTLPDIESDAASGRRSIAVVLGRRRALWVILGALLAPVALLALTLVWVEYEPALLGATLAGYAALLTGAGIAYRRGGRDNDVRAFRFVVVASVLYASGWLAAV